MYDLGALTSAKKKAEVHHGRKEEDFQEEYNQALALLKEFSETQKQDKLKKAADKFFIAIKCKRSRVEPYCYLSYIFYLFDEEQLAIEYLNLARSIDSSYPEIQEIQKLFI